MDPARTTDVHEAAARCLAELDARGAASAAHSRWSLLQHLEATYAILRGWNQPDDVCLAGLMHSVYATDTYARATFSTAERPRVRELAGFAAERLAYMFCAIERASYLTLDVADGASLRNRWTSEEGKVGLGDLAALRTIHLANAAEQNCARDGAPARGLVRAGRIVARIGDEHALPAAVRACAHVDASAEAALLAAYASATGATAPDDLSESAATLRRAASGMPVGEPFAILGLLELAAGRFAQAARDGRAARLLLDDWKTPWDKRLPLGSWLRIARFLERIDAIASERRAFLAARADFLTRSSGLRPEALYARLDAVAAFEFERDVPAAETAHANEGAASVFAGAIPERFARYVAGFGDPRRGDMSHYPGLAAQPWYDAADFPLARDFEAASDAIRAEFERIEPRHFHRESEKLERTGEWDVFMLFERGEKREENCALAPVTTALIEKHRTVRSMAGLAYFSRLGPATTIAPHSGPTNMRVRLHLGIDVPAGCSITVGGERRTWRDGRCLVFDDSFEHEVENASDRARIVLIVDLWHPDLNDEEVRLLEGLQNSVERSARSLAVYWSRNERARSQAPVNPLRAR